MNKRGNAIRVMLTISEKTMPGWYAYLSRFSSGYVRAEIIRAYLKEKEPGSIDIFAPNEAFSGANQPANSRGSTRCQAPESDDRLNGEQPVKKEEGMNETTPSSTMAQSANSESSVEYQSPAPDDQLNEGHLVKKTEETNEATPFSPDAAPPPPSGAGLASALIQSGAIGRW